MLASRARHRAAGRTRRSSRCGVRATRRTSCQPVIMRSTRSPGCRTAGRSTTARTSWRPASTRTLDGRKINSNEVAEAFGMHPNSLRYAALTGTVLIRWDGARRPTVWTVPAPDLDPQAARLELARRYLHVGGPSTAEAFADWAGISEDAARTTFGALGDSLTPVRTPIGDAWILASDEPALRAGPRRPNGARLLPSGDPYYLAPGRRPGAPRPRRRPPRSALDPARLARRRSRRRRDRRHLAASEGDGDDPAVGRPHAEATARGRGARRARSRCLTSTSRSTSAGPTPPVEVRAGVG